MTVSAARGEPMTAFARWTHALKPASWPKLLVPAFLGQAIGVAHVGGFSARGLAFGAAFTIADLVFIVLMNDWGDREVDAIKRRLFPTGCSPKTIPDGILPAHVVLFVGAAAGALAVAIGALHGGVFALGAIACVGVFVAYTLPPVRLNYRGGGEVLEAFGVGVALPWMNFHAQSGATFSAAFGVAIAGYAALSFASACASGLSDEESDRAGGKTTLATMLGNRVARRISEACLALGAIAWLAGSVATGWPAAIAGLVVLALCPPVFRTSRAAVRRAFAEQGRYKLYLHRAIWYGGAAFATAALIP